jgi:hypothetical protein
MENDGSYPLPESQDENRSAWIGARILSRAFAGSVFSNSFRGTFRSLSTYWKVYGGLEALIVSPFMIAAGVLTAVCAPLWSNGKSDWTSDAITILPCLLGFSVSALAIVLTFPSNPIFRHFAEDGTDKSYYMGVSARLVHFIMAQVFAFTMTFLAKAYHGTWISCLGFLSLMYAIFAAASTGLSFFGAARMFNASERPPSTEDTSANDSDSGA